MNPPDGAWAILFTDPDTIRDQLLAKVVALRLLN